MHSGLKDLAVNGFKKQQQILSSASNKSDATDHLAALFIMLDCQHVEFPVVFGIVFCSVLLTHLCTL